MTNSVVLKLRKIPIYVFTIDVHFTHPYKIFSNVRDPEISISNKWSHLILYQVGWIGNPTANAKPRYNLGMVPFPTQNREKRKPNSLTHFEVLMVSGKRFKKYLVLFHTFHVINVPCNCSRRRVYRILDFQTIETEDPSSLTKYRRTERHYIPHILFILL